MQTPFDRCQPASHSMWCCSTTAFRTQTTSTCSPNRKLASNAVIMMTAFGSAEVMTGALKLGAYQIISKPFEVTEVAASF